jgi:nitroreductase
MPVSKELIDQLLRAATQAPSAMNSQPWAFAVIQNNDILKKISDRAKELLLSVLAEKPIMEKYRGALSNPDFNIFYNASTLIIIYAKPEGPHPETDCCLAAQNIMLAARDAGLGSCWIGFAQPLLNLPDLKNELKVPAEYMAVAPLVIGEPAGKITDIPRKEPEILFWK